MDGKRIAAARKAKGWSQEKLGQMMGLSQQAIAKYEGPRGDVSGETLLQLSGVLGVTVSYLLGVDGGEEEDPRMSEIRGIFDSLSDEGKTALLGAARGLMSVYPREISEVRLAEGA